MKNLTYSPILRRGREAILDSLDHGTAMEIGSSLLSAAYWDPDWKWAEGQLIRFASHQDPQVMWAVASGFGLIAALHAEITLETVEPILRRLLGNTSAPGVSDAAQNSMDEIEHFVIRRRAGEPIDPAERMPEDRGQT
jgi:hypothetical protein